MSHHYVSHNGTQLGPWSIEEITAKVKTSELSLMDYIYDENTKDWVLLMEYGPLASKLKDAQPKPAPPPGARGESKAPLPTPDISLPNIADRMAEPVPMDTAAEHREWYILKGENKFGPFAYTDVVRMLQQKAIFEFDFAWYPGLEAWKRIAEFGEFAPDFIRQLKKNGMKEVEEIFFRRRHRRVRYGGTILVHDNKTVWKGQGVEISAGGAGVIMENATIVPGQVLYLHFKPGDNVPPFNAVCEVVNKKFVEGVREKNAPIRYGLKFVSISPATQKFLDEFTTKQTAA